MVFREHRGLVKKKRKGGGFKKLVLLAVYLVLWFIGTF